MTLAGCKHLEYDEKKYPTCELRKIKGCTAVRYWYRTILPYSEAPKYVQFCKLRGRINGVFDCYRPGGNMRCFEKEELEPKKTDSTLEFELLTD